MKQGLIPLDGAVGTSLWEKSDNKVPVWRYNLENPGIVSELHHEYIEAGARIILSNTFGANGGAVAQSPYTVKEVVSAGVRLAKEATAGSDVKVALSVGPLSTLLEPYGDTTAEEADALYTEMIDAGMAQGADLILLQTFMDAEMIHIAGEAANRWDVPLFCAMSFEANGYTMMGNSVADFIRKMSDLRVDAIGLNCSLEPAAALPVMAQFREHTDKPLLFKPNAGKPKVVDGGTCSGTDIETFVEDILPAAALGVTYLGGCCGTNAAYIRRLVQRLNELYPD